MKAIWYKDIPCYWAAMRVKERTIDSDSYLPSHLSY
jgi:hypothetical protein